MTMFPVPGLVGDERPFGRSGLLLLILLPMGTPFLGFVASVCFRCDILEGDPRPPPPSLTVRLLLLLHDGSADRTILVGDSDPDRREDDFG